MLQLESPSLMPQLQGPRGFQLQGPRGFQLQGPMPQLQGTLGASPAIYTLAGLGGALLGAAVNGVVMGFSLNSYRKHGDNPVRGGVTYGIGTLVSALAFGGLGMLLASSANP